MSWLILVVLVVLAVLAMLIVAGPVLEDLIDRVWPPGRGARSLSTGRKKS